MEPLGSWCHIKWKNKQQKKEEGTRQSSLLNLELGNTLLLITYQLVIDFSDNWLNYNHLILDFQKSTTLLR